MRFFIIHQTESAIPYLSSRGVRRRRDLLSSNDIRRLLRRSYLSSCNDNIIIGL